MDITYLVHAIEHKVARHSSPIARLALCVVLCGSISPSGNLNAQAVFPIEVRSNLHELDLKVASSNAANQVLVSIENNEAFDVLCEGRFYNGPQNPIERRAVVHGGKSATMSAPLMRAVTVVSVDLDCNKQQP
jgi:hypothetical protein